MNTLRCLPSLHDLVGTCRNAVWQISTPPNHTHTHTQQDISEYENSLTIKAPHLKLGLLFRSWPQVIGRRSGPTNQPLTRPHDTAWNEVFSTTIATRANLQLAPFTTQCTVIWLLEPARKTADIIMFGTLGGSGVLKWVTQSEEAASRYLRDQNTEFP